jgi:hypothetical protein
MGLSTLRADTFELVNGGRVEGRLIETTEGEQPQYVIELDRGGRMTIARSEVAKIDAASPSDVEYKKLARSSPDTVEAHWKLAEWCRERNSRTRDKSTCRGLSSWTPTMRKPAPRLAFVTRMASG